MAVFWAPPLTDVLAPATTPVSAVNIGNGAMSFPAWRPTMFEAFSGSNIADFTQQDAKPWQLLIAGSGGGVAGPFTVITVRAGARLALYGKDFTLKAINLGSTELPVAVRAYQLDNLPPTSNVLDQGFGIPASAFEVPIPPYARTCRFDVPLSQRGSVYLEILNPAGDVCGRYAWADQPSEGIPVGFAAKITMNGGSAGYGRVTFYLEL